MSKLQVITFASGKGGTGKSLISANVAFLLSHLGYKTLLIDTDFFTGGLTFYVLSNTYHQIEHSLSDYLREEKIVYSNITSIKVKNEFCAGNLFIMPSIDDSENILNEYNSIDNFFSNNYRERFAELIKYLRCHFEFIIIDTRGGSDFSTINSCLRADAYILITEADKTSWDTGKLLLKTIRNNKIKSECMGFIINKNILPPESIISFLKKEWRCPHIETIPLDIDAIKEFQLDKVPIESKQKITFSKSIVRIIEKILDVNELDVDKNRKLNALIELQKEENRNIERTKRRIKSIEFLFEFISLMIPITIITLFLTQFIDGKEMLSEKTNSFVIIGLLVASLLFSAFQRIFRNTLDRLQKHIKE